MLKGPMPVCSMCRKAYFILVSCFMAIGMSTAQEEKRMGTLVGMVVDKVTSEPLAGANVVIPGTALGASTDREGKFLIKGIPVGTYGLRVSILGYVPYIMTDVVVSTSKPAELLIPLVERSVQVDSVEVTASYFQTLPETPVSTFSQSNEEIRRLPGGLEDVVRAISILPGVAQVQAGRNDLIVRGGAPSENLFVVDHLEIPNINHFGTQGATGGPLSFVNLDFVEGTSFSTGGFGVQYGDKLSSVLSINLREGRKDRVGGKATISASQFGVNLEGPVSQSGTFIVSARRSYLDFIFKAAGFGFVPEYWDFLAKADYRLTKNDRLSFLAIGAVDDVKFFDDTPEHRFDNSRILGSAENQIVGGLTWQHLVGDGLLTVSLGQNYVDYRYGQSDSLLNPIFKSSSIENESSLRADFLFHAAKSTEVTVGISGKIPRFSGEMMLPPFTTSLGDSLQIATSYVTTALKGAVYAQVSQTIDIARITLGGRIDYFNLIDQKAVFSPRFSFTIPLSEELNINASAGRYYQAPSYVWLAANPENRTLNFIGANQFIVGIDAIVRPDTKASIEGYVKRYFDYPASVIRPYLILANAGAGYGGSEDGFASFGLDPLVSRGSGLARGVEFLAQKKLSEIPCYGTISISYNVAEFTALDGISRPSNWDQRWILNVGGGYILDEAWEFSAKFRYTTGRPYTPFNADGSQDPALYNTVRVEPNHSLDVRVDRRWSFDTWTLITYVDVQNVYNRKPVDVPRYNTQTKRVEQNGSLGILPSVGISAEF
ncbi:MAG: TonB-dependent receptor [Bacteroidota bacterium]